MNESEQEEPQRIQPAALERLRDRTDELELIISSLTIFALFSVPGWMFERYADVYTHLSPSLLIGSSLGIILLTGFCYVLGACFVIHLMARAYWVGLIGLRTTFPEGINWDRTGAGPLTKEHHQTTLPNSEAMIHGTDKFASSLFAIISMITLGALWLGAIGLLILVPLGTIGARVGATNEALGYGQSFLIAIYVGVPLLTYLLDAVIGRRLPSLQSLGGFRALVTGLRWVSKVAYPSRLILPVKLTLQSNTRPALFTLALIVGAALIFAIGTARFSAWQSFTLSGQFTYFDNNTPANEYRSTFYEDTISSYDRIRGNPRITSFEQSGSYMRVFLPYHPFRDNLVLDQICTDTVRENDIHNCLRSLWSVSVSGVEVDLAEFLPAERFEIRMRGLIGAVPLDHLEPGINILEVKWNPDATPEEIRDLGDRYQSVVRDMNIPFLFNPPFERTF